MKGSYIQSLNMVHVSHTSTHLSVVHSHAADDAPWPDNLVSGLHGRKQADNLDDRIGTAAIRLRTNPLEHSGRAIVKIEWLSAKISGELQAALNAVNSEDLAWGEPEGGNDGAEPDGSETNNDNDGISPALRAQHLAGVGGAEESSGPDVAHEQGGIGGQGLRSAEDGAIGEGHADVLGLGTVELLASK